MLILSVVHSKKWPELIHRLEEDAVKAIERIFHTLDNISITSFIENLLGTTARELLNSWKINYPAEYHNMIDMVDNWYNITSQIRQIILGTNASRGDTFLKDLASWDLDRLQISSFNEIVKFSQAYLTLSTKIGKTFSNNKLTKRWLNKLPRLLGDIIYKSWVEKEHENLIGIGLTILFTFNHLKEKCLEAEATRQITSYNYCNQIYIYISLLYIRNIRKVKS